MMWKGSYEPLFVEHLQGEAIDFYWRQEGGKHYVRALWNPLGAKGNPWDMFTVDAENTQRHVAIEEATAKINQLITAHRSEPHKVVRSTL